jgi:putative effector of murein hydrolase
VILTGIVGAMTVTPLLNALRVTDPRAGLRGGRGARDRHGRAFQVDAVAETFAGIALGRDKLATALLAPALLAWLR